MKQKLFFLLSICIAMLNYGQNKRNFERAAPSQLKVRSANQDLHKTSRLGNYRDTIRYAQAKEQILGTSKFNTFNIWQVDNEGYSQTFLTPAGGLQIHGVEFYGMLDINSSSNVSVRASIYNVNTSKNPIGSPIATGTVIAKTAANYHYVSFSAPVTVTADYAVVLTVDTALGIFSIYINNPQAGQSYDEDFARFKSTYYGNGSWTPIQQVQGLGGTYQFEALLAPIVSYNLNTTGTLSTTDTCANSSVNFTNTTVSDVLSNRMYNYNQFLLHFGKAASDKTYAWDMNDGSDVIYSGNTSYTYIEAGMYSPTQYSIGGFWASAVDFKQYDLTIRALPNANVTVNGNTLTATENDATYQWINCADNSTVEGATGKSFTPSSNGSYAVIVTSTNGCSVTSSCQTVAVLDVRDSNKQKVTLYPIPAKSILNIKGLNNSHEISIIDQSGRIIRTVKSEGDQISLDIQNLKTGSYFVRINNGQSNEVVKFIKQ